MGIESAGDEKEDKVIGLGEVTRGRFVAVL